MHTGPILPEFVIEGAELRQYKHKFLKRLDMYHDLKFDEKRGIQY